MISGYGLTVAPSVSDAQFAEVVLRSLAQGWLPGLSWLDGGSQGRSFVGAEPDLVIEGDDLSQLDEVDKRWRANPSRVWMGWLTYELGADRILERGPGRGPRPGLCMRRYGGVLERGVEGEQRAHGDAQAVSRLVATLRKGASARVLPLAWPLEPLTPRMTEQEYRQRVTKAKEYIADGQTYQINLSQSFGARWTSGSPTNNAVRVASAYAQLRRRWPAAMGAVLQADDDTWFLSNSPETLLDVRRDSGKATMVARSWPIKGTRPRHADPRLDDQARSELWHSDKDRAEHLMIVDLVRNDLGRIAVPGSVQTHPEPEPLTLPTVHHLVTEVRAEIPADTSLRSMVEAVFPGGSITGAPKKRTVELIDELESIFPVSDVFLMGHSNGGFMAYRMACDHAGRVASIAAAAPLDAEGLTDESPPVEVRIDVLGEPPAAARPGMTATVRIHCGQRSLGYVWLHDAAATVYRWLTF